MMPKASLIISRSQNPLSTGLIELLKTLSFFLQCDSIRLFHVLISAVSLADHNAYDGL